MPQGDDAASIRPTPARGLDHAWRWRIRVRIERYFSVVRAVMVCAVLILWRTHGPVPGVGALPVWIVGSAAVLFAAGCGAVLWGMPQLAPRLWPGYAVGDVVLTLACLAVTGLGRTPFLPLLFIATITVPQRTPLAGGVATGAVCVLTWALLAPPPLRWAALVVAVVATMQVLTTVLVRDDRSAVARDPLTGCFGRGQILTEIGHLVEQRAFPFSLILVDLDRFKEVNDRCGHAVGDRALQAAARHIASSIRDNDLLARYGGDEFLVVLAGTDGRTAAQVAERIRGSLAHGRFVVGPGTDIQLTLSAGVVEAQPEQTVTDILQTIDQYLYRAKRDRNRIWAEA